MAGSSSWAKATRSSCTRGTRAGRTTLVPPFRYERRHRRRSLHLAGMNAVAIAANAVGRFDAVIHNAGVGYESPPHRDRGRALPRLRRQRARPYVLTATMLTRIASST